MDDNNGAQALQGYRLFACEGSFDGGFDGGLPCFGPLDSRVGDAGGLWRKWNERLGSGYGCAKNGCGERRF